MNTSASDIRLLYDYRNLIRPNVMNKFAGNVRRFPRRTSQQHMELLSNFDGGFALFFLVERTYNKMVIRNLVRMTNIGNRRERNDFYSQNIITTDRERKATPAPLYALKESFNGIEPNEHKHILCSPSTHFIIREGMNEGDAINYMSIVPGQLKSAEKRLSLGADIWRDLGHNPEDLETFRDTIPDPDELSRLIDDMEI